MITCLIVDDDPVLRELVGDHLTRYGLKARLADSAAAMRLELQRGGIDIILLDLMLPDGGGIVASGDVVDAKTELVGAGGTADTAQRSWLQKLLTDGLAVW